MQTVAPKTQHFGKEAFHVVNGTEIRWLGNSGALVNSRGADTASMLSFGNFCFP